MRIFEFENYREYLEFRLDADGARSGLRKKMAEFIPVHTTYVSQVLKGRAEFSLEQAELINEFLEHSEDECEFFTLLLLRDRSHHSKLKRRFDIKIKTMRDERLKIKNRLSQTQEISQKDRERFYSNSLYAAIHVLSSLEEFQTIESLASGIKLSRKKIREMVDFLIRINILTEVGGRLKPNNSHVHLNSDSELILKHHINWRQHTINNLQFLNTEDLHYSACMTLSVADAAKIKESMLANLKANVDIISKSKDETAFVMSFDFYKLLSDE